MQNQPSPQSPTVSLHQIRLFGILSLVLLLVALIVGVIIVNAQINANGPASVTTGSPEQIKLGEQLFMQGTDGAAACSLCHRLDGVILVGPSLQYIATTAATRVAGQSAQDYIHTSIVNPTAYLVRGFESGSMVVSYANTITTEETEALVAFLMTQK